MIELIGESAKVKELKERIGLLEQAILGLMEIMKANGLNVTLNIPIEGKFAGQINTSLVKDPAIHGE